MALSHWSIILPTVLLLALAVSADPQPKWCVDDVLTDMAVPLPKDHSLMVFLQPLFEWAAELKATLRAHPLFTTSLHNPAATATSLSILRDPALFHWNVIFFLALVVYIYSQEIAAAKWNSVAASLALYAVHWAYEIGNALIQYFTGHALWTVPTGTSFLLLVGVSVELSMMFSVSGIVFTKLLPAKKDAKILGVNNRTFMAVANALFYSVMEIFLVKTPAFVWVYPWWGCLPVFITTYIPFFLACFWCYDWSRKVQVAFVGTLFALDVCAFAFFGLFLHWI